MVETALSEVSPWSGMGRRGRFGNPAGDAGVSITEVASAAMALMSLRRGAETDVAQALAAAGLELPQTPRVVRAQGSAILWAGPGQWLVRRPGTYAQLEADFAALGRHMTFIDQSHARAVLSVSGPKARSTLAKGFEIDLHPRAFATGDLAITAAVGIAALIWQTDDRPTYEIAVPRSMAASFWDWITEAAAEFGCAVSEA